MRLMDGMDWLEELRFEFSSGSREKEDVEESLVLYFVTSDVYESRNLNGSWYDAVSYTNTLSDEYVLKELGYTTEGRSLLVKWMEEGVVQVLV